MTATLPTSLLALVDRHPLVLPGSVPACQAIAQLRASRRNYLLAHDGERIVGLLTACTALIWLDSEADLASIVAPCPTCGTTLPALPALLACYRRQQTRHLVLLEADGQLYGVLSRDRLLDSLTLAFEIERLSEEASERQYAQVALRESEERFRQFAENIQSVFWMFEPLADQLLYVSPAYETIWQRSRQELYADNSLFLQTVHPSDRQQVESALTSKTSGNYDIEYRIVRPNGSVRWIHDRAFPIRDASGRVYRIAGIAEDITERKSVEQMKDEFISIVSHELRTPMTSIHGALKLLGTGRLGLLSPQGKNMLAIAIRNSDRLKRLIDDILSLERLQGDQLAVNQRHCWATELVAAALETVQPLADRAGVVLDTSAVAAGLAVWADAELIVQVLVNVLANAIAFSPVGATVAIAATAQPEVGVQFAVRDRGPGIPRDKLELIFERFQQVDPSDARQRGGSGLGLTICRQILQLHGGRIWAESELGAGSSFYFILAPPPEAVAIALNELPR